MPLQVSKKQTPNGMVAELNGVIDETTSLSKLLDPVPNELYLNCKGVTRINSVGVKSWVFYFSTLKKKGVKLHFTECSPALVQQMSLFVNTVMGANVESVYATFVCKNCKKETLKLYNAAELENESFEFGEIPCASCGGPAELDDLPEVYLELFQERR